MMKETEMASLTENEIMVLRRNRAFEAWYQPRQTSQVVANRAELFDFCATRIGAHEDLRYLEFGVGNGWSIRKIASIFTNPAAHFVGFDSFEGLPEAWGRAPAGTFSRGGEMPHGGDTRIEFVKGWFQNSLGDFLPRLDAKPKSTTLVQFDADLYSSTLFVLTALWWRIKEYYFIFDQFLSQEIVALHDFASAYPVTVEFLAVENIKGRKPVKAFGKICATRLSITQPGKAPAADHHPVGAS